MNQILDHAADHVAQAALAELQFFCEQRLCGVRSPELTEHELREFERRLPALIDSLLTRGPQIVNWLSSMLETLESPAEICGTVVVLLESREPRAIQAVISMLPAAADGPKRLGLMMALRRGPIEALVESLQKLCDSADSPAAAMAVETLAYHGRLSPDRRKYVSKLQVDADPAVRQAAWRALAYSQ